MKYRHSLHLAFRRLTPALRERGGLIRKFSKQIGLVYFGLVNQHEDDHGAIRGFSASLTHTDTHFAVGTYNGYDIRITDRLDVLHIPGHNNHQQIWTIIEVALDVKDIPHVFFVPTGQSAGSYARLFATQPYLLPLNAAIGVNYKSSEFHGRYQILARATHSHTIERLFSSPIIVGIGARFWPYGIELQHGKLYVYITDKKLTSAHLQHALTSALWLADTINETAHER